MFPHFGRFTIYIGGLGLMFFCLIAIGGLGFSESKNSHLAVGILLVISTLINMITTGPACYPIVAETPSGRLRYKTIVIGRFTYNLTGIFSNSVTPRMIAASCEYLPLCPLVTQNQTNKYHSLELGRENGFLLRRNQSSLHYLVLVPPTRDQGSFVWRDRSNVRKQSSSKNVQVYKG